MTTHPEPPAAPLAHRGRSYPTIILAVLISLWAVLVFLSYYAHTFRTLGLENPADLVRVGEDSFWGRIISWSHLLGWDLGWHPARIGWQFKPAIAANLALTGLIVLVCIGTGRSLLRSLCLLREPRMPGANCIAFALGLSFVIMLTLIFGYTRLMYRQTIWLMFGVLSSIAFRSYVRDWLQRGRTSHIQPERPPRNVWQRLGSLLITAYIVVILLIYLVSALAPETTFDSLNVFLYFGRLFNEEHRILDITPIRTNTSFYSMLLCSFSLSIYGAGIAKLLIFSIAVAGLRLVQVVTDRFAGNGAGRWAIIILLGVPSFTWTATVTTSDCQVMFFTLCMVTSASFLLTSRNWSWAYVAAITGGVAAGVKYHGLMSAALLAAVIVVVWSAAALRRRYGKTNAKPAVLPFRVRPLAVAVLVYLVIASPLYVRNYLSTGDPLFPFLHQYLPSKVMSVEQEVTLLRSNLHESMHFKGGLLEAMLLPWRVTMEGNRIQTPIGPTFLMAAPLVLLVRRWSIGTVLFAFFAVLWALIWQKTSVIGRHFPTAAVTLAVLCAFARSRFATTSRAGSISAGVLATLWIISAYLSLPAFTNRWFPGWCLAVREVPGSVVFGEQTEDDYLYRHTRALPMTQLINELNLPQRTRMICTPTGHILPFLTTCRMGDWDLYGAVFARPSDPEATFDRFQKERVEYVVWSYRDNERFVWPLFNPGSPFRKKYLTRVGDADGMVLFKVAAKRGADEPVDRNLIEEIVCGFLKPEGATELQFTRGHFYLGRPAWGLELRPDSDYSISFSVPTNGRLEATLLLDDRAAAHAMLGLTVDLILTSGDDVPTLLLSHAFLPEDRPAGGVVEAFDLSAFAGTRVTLRISVGIGSSRVRRLDRVLLQGLTLTEGDRR